MIDLSARFLKISRSLIPGRHYVACEELDRSDRVCMEPLLRHWDLQRPRSIEYRESFIFHTRLHVYACAAAPQWVIENRSATLSAGVADAGKLYLRWTISFPGGGSTSQYDQLAQDNMSVAAVPASATFLFVGLVCGMTGLGTAGRRFWAVRRRESKARCAKIGGLFLCAVCTKVQSFAGCFPSF